MIQLLASVTGPAEAEQAICGGADLIDCKDPTQGALGALPLERIAAIVSAVAGRRPVSATIGDLPAAAALTLDRIHATAATGVDYVKVGLFSDRHLEIGLPAIAALAPVARATGCAIVAVLFADRAPTLADLRPFATAGCAGVMLDTADKSGGRLLDHLGPARLAAFVAQARSLGLLCGLAGSLRLDDVPRLRPLGPDYLGFRGALCASGRRHAALDPIRLSAAVQALRPLEA
jgi:(5-formylfuran-3-yl)methyl phosphate synthase